MRGRLCSAVAEVVAQEQRLRLGIVGVPRISPAGSLERLLQRAVLDLDAVGVAAAGKVLDA